MDRTREALMRAMDDAFAETVPTYTHENAPHPHDIDRANMGGFEYSQFQDVFLEKALAALSAPSEPNERDQEILDALKLILPMAKGYAHANRVGANAEKIQRAEEVIAARSAKEKAK